MRRKLIVVPFVLVLFSIILAATALAQEGISEAYARAGEALHRGLAAQNDQEQEAAYREAVEQYTEELEANSNNLNALIGRGALYSMLGEYDKAIADQTAALAIEPNSVTALQNRAVAYEAVGNLEAAFRDFNKVYNMTAGTEFEQISPERFEIIKNGLAEVTAALQAQGVDPTQLEEATPTPEAQSLTPESPDYWAWFDVDFSRKYHNVTDNGHTVPNVAGWRCGNPISSTIIENGAWFYLPSQTHSREEWVKLGGVWGRRGWLHAYAGFPNWDAPPTGENYYVAVEERHVCLGTIGGVKMRGYAWYN